MPIELDVAAFVDANARICVEVDEGFSATVGNNIRLGVTTQKHTAT